jgi:hypothetical protein
MVEIPETIYSVLLIENDDIINNKLFNFQFDALQYINEIIDNKYIFVGFIDIKKGSKLIWIVEHNLETQESEKILLEKVNSFLFKFDEDWANEWA